MNDSFALQESSGETEVCVTITEGAVEAEVTIVMSVRPGTASGKCIDETCCNIIICCAAYLMYTSICMHSSRCIMLNEIISVGPTDYIALNSANVLFSPQRNVSCLIVTITDDNVIEDNEYFIVDLTGSDVSRVSNTNEGIQVRIMDNDGRKLEAVLLSLSTCT